MLMQVSQSVSQSGVHEKSSFMHWLKFRDSVFVFIAEGEKRRGRIDSLSVQFVSGYNPLSLHLSLSAVVLEQR